VCHAAQDSAQMAPSIITSDGTTRSVGSPPDSVSASPGYQAFDHILWYVGNARQAASFYITRMGFRHIAYVSHPSESLLTAHRAALRLAIDSLQLTLSGMVGSASSSDRHCEVPILYPI
jgi:hypothetical protein